MCLYSRNNNNNNKKEPRAQPVARRDLENQLCAGVGMNSNQRIYKSAQLDFRIAVDYVVCPFPSHPIFKQEHLQQSSMSMPLSYVWHGRHRYCCYYIFIISLYPCRLRVTNLEDLS